MSVAVGPLDEPMCNVCHEVMRALSRRCVCAAYCQNNLGSPELQTASENERMADAVLKCIQVWRHIPHLHLRASTHPCSKDSWQ